MFHHLTLFFFPLKRSLRNVYFLMSRLYISVTVAVLSSLSLTDSNLSDQRVIIREEGVDNQWASVEGGSAAGGRRSEDAGPEPWRLLPGDGFWKLGRDTQSPDFIIPHRQEFLMRLFQGQKQKALLC